MSYNTTFQCMLLLVGGEVATAMGRRGITVEVLAASLEMKPALLRRILSGNYRRLTVSQMADLAEAVGCTWSFDLLERTPE
ncbi:MAG: hypothetical protein JWP29_1933 [Rhodoferax sp.]|nr:hypothetical protein [Rhodoferax sp.]